ncbi:hypothetical protein ACFLYB_03265 [Chloroflexota bacterium]
MGNMQEVYELLAAGGTRKEAMDKGYPKSTVYHVANKVEKDKQNSLANGTTDDEIQELKRRKEILKLENEIRALEAIKENIPDRVTALESRLAALEYWCDGDLVENIGGCLYAAWRAAGRSNDDAIEASRIKKAGLRRRVGSYEGKIT